MKLRPGLVSLVLVVSAGAAAGSENLVANGSLEEIDRRNGAPADWASAGSSAVKQTLTMDVGHDGQHSAKLACTELAGDGPADHAMLAQSGHVAVRRGQWYRLTCWARGEAIK